MSPRPRLPLALLTAAGLLLAVHPAAAADRIVIKAGQTETMSKDLQ